MSRTKHTIEPWEIHESGDFITCSGSRGYREVVVRTCRYAERDSLPRTVSCVNACAGLELPDDVETGAVQDAMVGLRAFCAWWSERYPNTQYEPGWVSNARAALAKLEGK